MKAFFLATLSLLAASASPAQTEYTREQVIAYAKSIDVWTLDPSLPSQRLEDWLGSGPPRARIGSWSVDETCDLKPDSSSVDYPLCARIGFSRNGQRGFLFVQVGTTLTGIVGPPQVYGDIEVFEEPWVLTGGADRLSDLPALLDQPAITDGVRKMYEEIVAHHPVGIPTGAEMASIRPFLSKRLAEQLQTARACQHDYARQQTSAKRTPKPGWMTSGLFSGENSHALPVDVLVDRKEKQNDGSFLVYVDLEYDYIDLGHGRRAFNGNHSWRIATRVISENGQFVVDDVRVFDGLSTSGHSRLLSDSFAGCDGSLWTGTANR